MLPSSDPPLRIGNARSARFLGTSYMLEGINPFLTQPRGEPARIVSGAVADRLGMPRDSEPKDIMARIRSTDPETLARLGLHNPAPPENVHWIGRKSGVFFDMRGANEIASAIENARMKVLAGNRYLDFGCSSGRTVRTFQVAFPDADWYGADPDPVTIDWASGAFPELTFHASPQLPPLDVPDGHFTGVYAISVWSHFREDVARRWFDEMLRVIRPGGFLTFTTGGYAKFVHIADHQADAPNRENFKRRLGALRSRGFTFHASFADVGNRNLDTSFWGMAEISLAWVVQHLVGAWGLRWMEPAGNGHRQDIYVLERI